ncbi:hypothetical protein Leryth_003454 [Lithospermum erythrorhizon]|nr:hypothetical protein Leryth_003454 [Lithospermum erythrorhizon]
MLVASSPSASCFCPSYGHSIASTSGLFFAILDIIPILSLNFVVMSLDQQLASLYLQQFFLRGHLPSLLEESV